MRACTLASGSSGNATYIAGDEAAVLVDAGLSGKMITAQLDTLNINPLTLRGILVTHEHSDHIKGVGIVSRKYDLKIYATEKTWDEISPVLGKVPPYTQCVLEQGKVLEIGDLKVEHFKSSHDAVDSVGYAFCSGDTKIGVSTDTGFLTNNARKCLEDSDLLIFEANHDVNMLRNGTYPWALKKRISSDKGHLSNIAAGHCLASLACGKTKGVILAHLSSENNLPELAYSTVAEILEEAGLSPGKEFALEVAPRFEAGTLWQLD
ncbi:MAG: MBL fold metallo-hydrolase [Thermincola sp.]|jgi:phosphoribosyl 1,2-cyclic phosphodiesterase|nr:MBL fold metallo-hydrolase [Thermincola sp.]MDT3702006.1 MBL fold metallo-hydrolase [Thermincola sp.]